MIELDKREGKYHRSCRVLMDGELVCTVQQWMDCLFTQWGDVNFILNGGLTGEFAHRIDDFPGVIDGLQQAYELAQQWQSERTQDHESENDS